MKKIEESFRINNHTLKMRPIFHRLSAKENAKIAYYDLSVFILHCFEIDTKSFLLRSRGYTMDSEEFLNILSGIERWVLRIRRTASYIEEATLKATLRRGKRDLLEALKLERKQIMKMRLFMAFIRNLSLLLYVFSNV